MFRRSIALIDRVGQAAAVFLGAVVILGLLLGPASLGLAAVGDPLRLGKPNSALDKATALAADLAGPVLKLTNKGSGPALQLQVGAGQPPLKINPGAGTAPNLSADKLDGIDLVDIVHADTPTYQATNTGNTGTTSTNAFVSASCDAGDRLQAGGYLNLSPNGRVEDSQGSATNWTVEVLRTDANSASVTTEVVCYDFAPLR